MIDKVKLIEMLIQYYKEFHTMKPLEIDSFDELIYSLMKDYAFEPNSVTKQVEIPEHIKEQLNDLRKLFNE